MKKVQMIIIIVMLFGSITISAQKCDPTACLSSKNTTMTISDDSIDIVMENDKMMLSTMTSHMGMVENVRKQKKIKDSDYVLIDLVVLNAGFTETDRASYSKKTVKIASKYGIDMAQSYKIGTHIAGMGPKNALEFNLWTMPSPTAMVALSGDTEYQANVPNRDKIHDMEALTLFLARPKVGYSSFTPNEGKTYLLDFVIMNEGAGALQRSIYNQKTKEIAKKHGIEMVSSFDVLQKLGGQINGVLEVNIWEMDSPASMKALGSDTEYQANIEFRDQIHNIKNLTLYMASSK